MNWMQCNFIQTNPVWADAACGVDTHDGFSYEEDEHIRRKVRERANAYRTAREQLRSDIILAMDGQQEAEALQVVRESMGDELARVQSVPDYEPELRGMLSDMSALQRIARLAMQEQKRRDDEDEGDVEFLLLQ